MSDTALKTANGSAKPYAETETRVATVTPRVDVLETEDGYLILADMPGVQPEDVDVRFENGELTVHGRRSSSHPDKAKAAREFEVIGYFRSFQVTEQNMTDTVNLMVEYGGLDAKAKENPKVFYTNDYLPKGDS